MDFAGCVSKSVAAINTTATGEPWLTPKQLDDLRDQILRQPNRTLLEANEAIQALLLKAQVDCNEVTGEQDPVVKLIDFAAPRAQPLPRHQPVPHRHAGLREAVHHPRHRAVRERHPAGGGRGEDRRRDHGQPDARGLRATAALPQRPPGDPAAGLREGEPRLFHTNLLLIRTCGEKAEFGTITSGHEHFYRLEGHLAGEQPSLHAAAGRRARTGAAHPGAARPPNLLDVLRTCIGVHGHGLRTARQGGVPLSAIPRGRQDRATACARQDAGRTFGRRLAHPGLGQVADDGVRRSHDARLQRI